MSDNTGASVPSSDPPGPSPLSSWDPLGPGPGPGPTAPVALGGQQLPANQQTAYGQQNPYGGQNPPQQPYPLGYEQQPYPPQPYLQPGYPAQPVWVPPVPVYPYAAWIRRVGAFLIDFAPTYAALIPFYAGYVMAYLRILRLSASGQADPEQTLAALTGTPLVLMGVGLLLTVVAFGWQWYNRWLVAGRTGQSMGKRMLELQLVAEINGQPIGPVNAFLRDLLHALDAIAYIGYLWPLWDAKRQTFSDMIMKTVVVDLRSRPAAPVAGQDQTPDGTA